MIGLLAPEENNSDEFQNIYAAGLKWDEEMNKSHGNNAYMFKRPLCVKEPADSKLPARKGNQKAILS